jgi:signal transduction histidine kinase/PAS domain-containing protein
MTAGHAQPDEDGPAPLARFILSHKAQILALWERTVRTLPTARDLPKPVLLDSVPQLLDSIVQVIADRVTPEKDVPPTFVEAHAFQRLDTGFDLGQVVAEYSLLRDAILELWDQEPLSFLDKAACRVLHRAIDQCISLSVERFTRAQIRAARALDRIATASLESHDLDDLLRRLLLVLAETMPAVDAAAILLRAGEMLTVRAAVGLEGEVELGFTVKIGEGFAGKVAAERRPVFVKPAATDGLVDSPVPRERKVRALYGVPLIERSEVVGVAMIGSVTAYDFSEEDRRMVASLASRATAAIYQQLLRHDADSRAAELHAVIESIPDALYIADRTRITAANRQGLALLGVSALEEVSTEHADILRRLNARDPLTGAAIEQGTFLRAFAGDTNVREMAIVRADGEERIIRSVAEPIEIGGKIDLAVCVTTDVTEVRLYEQERAALLERERAARARAEAAESGQRFLSEATAILASSLDYQETLERVTALAVPNLAAWCSVDLVGADGALRTVSVVHADPEKTRTARDLMERYPIRSDAPFGAPEVIRTGRAQMRADIPDDILVRVAQNDQHLASLRELGLASYIVVPLSAQGRVFGALSLATSRESHRRYGPAELEIATHLGCRAGLAIQNARLYREAREAVRQREQLLAIVSHDLRNPLGAVRMAAGALASRAREQREPQPLKYVETILRSATRMDHLIGDLLDMASMQVGRFKIERRSHPAQALIQEAVEPYQPTAAEQGICFATESNVGDLQVDCDRERVLQVFSNLLGNAFKFSHRGDRITVRAQPDGRQVRFEVADTGPGIPPADRQHIFEPYWSAERHRKSGTGLGLFIARGVVEAHDGKLWVDSEPGRGATFFFTLPIAPRT